MLVRSVLSPADLGISEHVHRALILALQALERGELRAYRENPDAPGHLFDMRIQGHARSEHDSVGCIAWTAERLGGLGAAELSSRVLPAGLYELLFPALDAAWTATPAQAAQATASYLATGAACWSEAMTD